jgi:glycosyltransferase involved in cell wall biosynthesis
MSQRNIVFNGKFLSAWPTGVHRVAYELIDHLDAILARQPEVAAERRWDLIKPRDARRTMALDVVRERVSGILTWQTWEQFELPLLAGRSTLVSLCNLAPILRPGGVTMIHDAQVFISPDSYGAVFAQWYRFALPRIGRSSDLILTVSEYSRQRLAEFGVAPLEKIEVVHNGADHLARIPADEAILDRLALTPGRYVVCLANVQKHKNIQILLQAFARPAMSGLSLVLMGDKGPAEIAGTGPAPTSNVLSTGKVTDGEMRALMENAACLAFPSTTEGFGLPPLEAMSLGCPAIVAPCGALPEVCGEAALYADPDVPAAWESAILNLLESPTTHAEYSRQGRAHAANFSWAKSAARMLGLVRNVADR